jgi:hypothetical protein
MVSLDPTPIRIALRTIIERTPEFSYKRVE